LKRIGLTGGIGMGKSTADKLLRDRGVPLVDTDLLAHELVEPGQASLAEILDAFGPEILKPEGRLDRAALAKRVFADPAARQRLEGILHPRIRAAWRAQFETWAAENRPLAVVVIPLLFETGAEAELDATICVACSASTQQTRLLARGWPPEQIQQRIRAQWPIEKKIADSNYVIWTEAGLDVHAAQLTRVLSSLV
jgi:dephospho-CoA kinase